MKRLKSPAILFLTVLVLVITAFCITTVLAETDNTGTQPKTEPYKFHSRDLGSNQSELWLSLSPINSESITAYQIEIAIVDEIGGKLANPKLNFKFDPSIPKNAITDAQFDPDNGILKLYVAADQNLVTSVGNEMVIKFGTATVSGSQAFSYQFVPSGATGGLKTVDRMHVRKIADEVLSEIPESGGIIHTENTIIQFKPANSSNNQSPSYVTDNSTWKSNSVGWWYENADGSYAANEWKKVNGEWYFFNGNGYMTTGWQMVGDTWYFLDNHGAMKTGWAESNGKWYYLNPTGAMASGWLKDDTGAWYFLNPQGDMAIGWVYTGSDWYYLDGKGVMSTGWVLSNGKWYYLNKNGDMAVNIKTPDGYKVGKNGELIA